MKISIFKKGNILFFYRSKVQREPSPNLNDTQHLFIMLKPEHKNHFIFIIVEREKLPEQQPYFGFVEKIAKNLDQ